MSYSASSEQKGLDAGADSRQAHIPVLLDEVVDALAVKSGGVYLDATFGRGGYSRAILAVGEDVRVIGLDRDPAAVAVGRALAKENPRFTMMRGAFSELRARLADARVDFVDGIAFDLGVSSPQLDEAERGFSFRSDGPLDMRMDNESGMSAAEVVNTWDAKALADALWLYGEERKSRQVAAAIVARRAEKPFVRTLELAEVVRSVVPSSKDGLDPATRTFQALRIVVNDELGELERALTASECVLREGGRLAVVSFHSLEDRMVKTFMRERSGRTPNPSRYEPSFVKGEGEAAFRLVTTRAIAPGEAECARNFRARSARLRVAEKQKTGWAKQGREKGGGQ